MFLISEGRFPLVFLTAIILAAGIGQLLVLLFKAP